MLRLSRSCSPWLLASLSLVLACGGGQGDSTTTSLTIAPETTGPGDGDPGDGDPGDGDPGDGDPGDGDPGDGDPTGAAKWDVLGIPDSGAQGCGGSGSDFSYIWIANSGQGTLSKIDTETLDEVGRYRVRPDSAGLPSRTSVNLAGDVAVANRTGGITKVYARASDCEESNGMPGIQTSTGANDILAWGVEECIAWYTPFAYGSQRPIAWTQGNYADDCNVSGAKVWTTGTSGQGGYADVLLLDGDTGALEDMVTINGLTAFNNFGGYGAVVDSDGNLWFNEMYIFGSYLVFVDIDDLSYELIPTNTGTGYGIAIDEQGRIFTCGANKLSRYDPSTNQWMNVATGLDLGGCMVDATGQLWMSGSNNGPYSIQAYDVDTLQQLYSYPMPEHVHGISIDFNGYVWGVAGVPGAGQGAFAYRIDPDTGDYDTVAGLVDAYTYSDMTGFALASSIQG